MPVLQLLLKMFWLKNKVCHALTKLNVHANVYKCLLATSVHLECFTTLHNIFHFATYVQYCQITTSFLYTCPRMVTQEFF